MQRSLPALILFLLVAAGGVKAQSAVSEYQRGVEALHNFWYGEAIDRFRSARDLDPGFVLAYWGEALSFHDPFGLSGGRRDSVRAAMERLAPNPATRAAKARSERERRYLEAMEHLLTDEPGEIRHRRFSQAMGRVVEEFPEDLEARALYARSFFGLVPSLRRDSALREEAAAVAATVLAQDPDHPGALHYTIHALDNPGTAHRAVEAADRYRVIVPDAPHAIHMPSHIYMQMGRFDDVEALNERAYRVSVDWQTRTGRSDEARDFHALSWLPYARLQKGEYEAAASVLQTVRQLADDTGSDNIRWYEAQWTARHVVETERWQMTDLVRSRFDSRDELLGRAFNALHTDRVDLAREIRGIMRGKAESMVARDPGSDGALAWRVALLEVEARFADRRGRPTEAIDSLRLAIELHHRQPPPNETPDPIKPPHEMLGELLLAQGRVAEAIVEFTRSLEERRGRARSLIGLARAYRAAGSEADARTAYNRLLVQWHTADPDLPEAREAQTFLEDTAESLESRR